MSSSTGLDGLSPPLLNPHFLTGLTLPQVQGWISMAAQLGLTLLRAWLKTQPRPSAFAPLTSSVMFRVSTTHIGYFVVTQDGGPLNLMTKCQKVRGGLWNPTLMTSLILSQRTCGTKFCNAKILLYVVWGISPMIRQLINCEVARQFFGPQQYMPAERRKYLPRSLFRLALVTAI